MQESLPEIHRGRELIGYGVSGFVYEFGPNTVLKIFHLPDNREFSVIVYVKAQQSHHGGNIRMR
jgi:hypothetical protein